MILAMFVLAGCGQTSEPVALTGETMGTTYSVKLARLPDGATLPTQEWRVDLITVVREGHGGSWRTTHHLKGLRPP